MEWNVTPAPKELIQEEEECREEINDQVEGLPTSSEPEINDKKRKGSESITHWAYGIGLEGWRKGVGNLNVNAVIVDDRFPWWALSVASTGINISRVWLINYPLVDVVSLSRVWFSGTDIEWGAAPSEMFLGALRSCDIMFVGGRVPRSLEHHGVWSNPRLQMVITTKQSDKQPPSPWKVDRSFVRHHKVGGVTNGKFQIVVHSRIAMTNPLRAHVSAQPSQDLRGILKNNEEGRLASPVKEKLPRPVMEQGAVSRVVYCGKNIVSSAGLYPIDKPGIKVHTEYRGQSYVIRDCSPFERLLFLDTPEKLIRLAESDPVRLELYSTISTPGKIFQHVVEWILQQCMGTEPMDSYAPSPPKFQMIEKLLDARSKITRDDKRRRLNGLRECSLSHDDTIHLPTLQKYRRGLFVPLPMIPEEYATCYLEDVRDTARTALVDPNIKATKEDDAEVRCELWDKHLLEGFSRPLNMDVLELSLTHLREGFLNVWKRNVQRSYFAWERRKISQGHTISPDIREAARECIARASNSSWWHWNQGSRPFFWRWEEEYQIVIREGLPPWFVGEMKPWTAPQRGPRNASVRKSVGEKLAVIEKKQYIEKGKIISLMPFFHVPKGEKDVRMVYDGSASGLNDIIWSPWFTLPTVDCLLRALEPDYSMADNDVGEMFHNFMLHDDMRQHCGLDLTLYPLRVNAPVEVPCWRRWTRLAMGLRSSPYNAVQGMLIAQEFILGDPADERNIFQWHVVRLNLPGSPTYSPGQAWVAKIRKDGRVAADIFIYVDDVRSSAWDDNAAWLASQRTSSRLGYLGLQDAARKRREPGQETGAWTGSAVWTSNHQLVVMTTQEKWDKTRDHLVWIRSNLNNKDGLDGKILKSIRGFLVYVARTYPSMTPYLKGIHATIDSWRSGRDVDGWKLKKRMKPGAEPESIADEYDEFDAVEMESAFGMIEECVGEPIRVFPVRRLLDDLNCLCELTASHTPPKRIVRMTSQARVIYGFGDASKQGFGASIEFPDKNLFWKFGQWRLRDEQIVLAGGRGISFIEERSSNYRELRNLVETLEEVDRKGLLLNREVFMFTDNSTAESAFFRGTSSSKHLFNLILRLRKIEMAGSCQIHMIHVAGTRMIWQGTDGLSRGDKNSGVMAGEAMTSFIPLHLTAQERSAACIDWVSDWYRCRSPFSQRFLLRILTQNDWPTVLREQAAYVWIPPPSGRGCGCALYGDCDSQASHILTSIPLPSFDDFTMAARPA